jgi:hypothetical protein
MSRLPALLIRLLLAASIALAPLIANPAQAAPPRGSAKSHVEKAARAYSAGRYAEAVVDFEEAYRLDAAPVLQFNIAQCYRQLGANQRAIAHYRRYLEELPDARNRADVEARIQELERATTSKDSDTRPLPPVRSETVTPAKPPGGEGETPTTEANAGDVEATAGSTAAEPPPAHPTLRTAAFITGGAAVIALGTGTVFQLVASGWVSNFDASCGRDASGRPVRDTTRSKLTDAQCRDLFEGWRQNHNAAIVSIVTGAALAVTSGILFYVSMPASGSGPARTAFACAPGLDLSVSCRLAF